MPMPSAPCRKRADLPLLKRSRVGAPLLALLLAAGNLKAQPRQPEPWHVPAAVLRVDVSVETRPAHPDLGVWVKIPDGGLLPGRFPVADVRDASGKPIEHLLVGHHPADGLGVLFAEPENSAEVYIYISGSNTRPTRPEKSRLFPSVVYYAKTGNASLDLAKRMAAEYPPALGAGFGIWPCIGSMVNPYGPDDDYASWFVGALLLEKPERIYFATVSNEGSEFAINGKTIHSLPGRQTRQGGAQGQHGAWVELGQGLHRIDYFHFEATGPQEAQLVWRRPGVTEGELPELVTGFAQSGTASISGIFLRDGRRAAVIRGMDQPLGYFWTGEHPFSVFNLAYSGLSPEQVASVAWEFGKGMRLADPMVEWLLTGDPDQANVSVTLAVSNAAGVARTSARLVAPWTPPKLSLDNQAHRLLYRKAFLNLIKAAAPGTDPCADWTRDHWVMLQDLLEPYRGGPILREILTRAEATLRKIAPEQRWALEDRYVEVLRLQRQNDQLLDWINRMEREERNATRKFRWRDERVVALLLDINNPELAEREANLLRESASSPDQIQIAVLRQGDAARALGKTDDATRFYSESQDRFQKRAHVAMPGGRTPFYDPERRKAIEETEGAPAPAQPGRRAPRAQSLVTRQRVDDWKIRTVHDASMHTTIASFLSQDAVAEAFQQLADWELQSPLSKLTGDYPLAEARVYMHVEDYRRAAHALAAYRRNVTMSASLAEAMRLEAECLERLNNRTALRELAAEFIKRFPGHPQEAEMKELQAR